MPAQPGATGPSWAPDGRTRPTRTQARGAGGPRDDRGRGQTRPPRGPGRWGTWQGSLGVCIIVASAAVGAVATVATRAAPGLVLQLCVVAGTVLAGFAVRPRAGWMIVPVPVLSYLVAALASGIIMDRSAGLSKTALAIAAAQWIAGGFFAMVLATVLAGLITAPRWFLWRRRRRDKPPGRDRGWPPAAGDPARTGRRPPGGSGQARTARRPREAWEASAEPGYPGTADTTRRRGDPGMWGTNPRPGPYNFSSGA